MQTVGSIRRLAFTYDLYDKDGLYKKRLNTVKSCDIYFSKEARIQRSLKLTMLKDEDIDFLSDVIVPTMTVIEVRGGEEEVSRYKLGRYMLSNTLVGDFNTSNIVSIEAFDYGYLLNDTLLHKPVIIKKGEPYMSVVEGLLREYGVELIDLPGDLRKASYPSEYPVGENLMDTINDILRQIGYDRLTFDNEGYATTLPFITLEGRKVTHSYGTEDGGFVLVGSSMNYDIKETYNVFTVISSNSNGLPMEYTWTNNDISDPFSVDNRGRKVSYVETLDGVADEESLALYVQNLIAGSKGRVGEIRFYTPLEPTHGTRDFIELKLKELNVIGVFESLEWSMELKVGGRMEHVVGVNFKEGGNVFYG